MPSEHLLSVLASRPTAMSIVTEVSDGIKLVTDGIENIQKIYRAVRDGKNYLITKHPQVKLEVAEMIIEMRKTLQAIAAASSLITHFRFNVSDQAVQTEPSRFNDYLMQYKAEAQHIEILLDSMRGHCHKIRHHAENMEAEAGRANLANMLKFFGLRSDEREKELSAALNRVYDEEMEFHSNVWNMRMILEKSLDDIGRKLGPPGTMDAKNVPEAAKALGEYATHFSKLESDANHAALDLQRLVDELSK